MTKSSIELRRLERVDLREAWTTEDGDFTPWLAEEANIELLGHIIGAELEVEARERPVGPFRADILCKDTATDQWVLIENQLERTDHTHLGQLMTYAAGLNAVTIVWVSSGFTDEHRAALDWLNEITSNEFRFFGLEIELWRIGSSPPAPKFNIVSKPNAWTKPSGETDLTPTKQLQLKYWEAPHEVMEKGGGNVRPAKPAARHWQRFSIGRTGFSLSTFANTKAKRIGIRLILRGDNAKAHYGLLSQEKDTIEQEANEKFEWLELPDNKESHINLRWHNCDPTDRESWSGQHRWLFEKLEVFHRVFAARLKELDADDFVEGNLL